MVYFFPDQFLIKNIFVKPLATKNKLPEFLQYKPGAVVFSQCTHISLGNHLAEGRLSVYWSLCNSEFRLLLNYRIF